MRTARVAVSVGDFAAATREYDELLGVSEPGSLPEKWRSQEALIVLERGTLQQGLGRYSSSARDFQAADKQLELLDLSADGARALGEYVYSDSATTYRASPVEKLSINAFNMLNYLSMGDLQGARVEAKRFTVMRSYLDELELAKGHGKLGAFLSGFVFEQLGEVPAAERYYQEAGVPSGAGQLLVVVSVGRVPYKVPERMPIGAAIGFGGAWITGDLDLLKYTALKFIVYPELADAGSVFRGAELWIDGSSRPLDLLADIGAEIRGEYEKLKPRIVGAAISRMIARAAAAEGARAAGRQVGGDDQSELVSLLFALLTEGALVAADRPDTRSWQLLPHWVYVHRASVTPGRHTVRIDLRGAEREERVFEIDVRRSHCAAVVVTAPR